jgi:hypothetical protein
MNELQEILERQVRQFAGGIFSQPQCATLDRAPEAD